MILCCDWGFVVVAELAKGSLCCRHKKVTARPSEFWEAKRWEFRRNPEAPKQ